METPQQPPSTPSAPTSPPEFVTLKVYVPSSAVSKTVRLPVKIKVKELHEILTKKLATLANAPQHIYEDYGFYWHSESGPVWLAETASLRAYNFKNNVSVEFRKRGTTTTPPSSGKHKKGKKETSDTSTQPAQPAPLAQPVQPPPASASASGPAHADSLRISAVRKMSAWVSSRPNSLYDQKKGSSDLKKERSQSVNLMPRKDPDTVVQASRFTSPSYSSTFETTPSSLLDTTPPASPRSVNPATLDDLDDLIDIFDDLADDPFGEEFSDERLLEEYAATIEQEDIEEAADVSDQESLSPRFTYAQSDTPSPPVNGTRQRSYSSPHGSDRYPNARPASTSPRYSLSPELEVTAREDDRKMPGLRGAAAKKDVRVAAASSILEDALEGIESGSVDMGLMKHYLTSALCILRTLT